MLNRYTKSQRLVMQLKKILCAIVALPVCAAAQQNVKTEKPEPTAKANVAEQVVLSPVAKTVKDSLVVAPPDNKATPSKLAMAEVNHVVKPVKEAAEALFKPVPLVGELDYYGRNHNQMLEYTKNYMRNFSGRLRTINSPERGGRYFAIIDKILEKYSIPKELKYLAVIESALNNNAVSPVGAVGPWQFMASTGKLMGLTINGRRDDRRDWVKSTHAACKYLTYLYDQLDDWLLVVAAYNSGPRPVVNAIKRTGKHDYWSIKPYLPKETQNHVLAFIATATIMERLNEYLPSGLPANFNWASLNVVKGKAGPAVTPPKNPLLVKFGEEELKKMAMIRIKSPIDLDLLANTLLLDRRQLGRWNYDYYDYIDTYKAGDTYNLRIPKEKLNEFIEKKDQLERQSAKLRM
jgi:membrane-bound lytic murein transglycosylase D